MAAVYNEIEPYAADWLENLVQANLIAPGRVERRSIVDLKPEDVAGPGQRHFFAGIGVWSYALRLAGIPDDLSVWSGSCPCQSFSTAGRKKGFADERHLWPVWFDLIRECRPDIILGEQVSSPDALKWLDLVHDDLEGLGYAVGAISANASLVGAPHLRQRLYFVAVAGSERLEGLRLHLRERRSQPGLLEAGGAAKLALSLSLKLGDSCEPRSWRDSGAIPDAQAEGEGERLVAGGVSDVAVAAGDVGGVADDAIGRRDERCAPHRGTQREDRARSADSCKRVALADDDDEGLQGRVSGSRWRDGAAGSSSTVHAGEPGPVNGFWSPADWIPCTDGKARPVEPGTFPLAHGSPTRVGPGGAMETPLPRAARLKGYGNAIVGPLAAEFIASVMDVLGDLLDEEPT